MWKWFPYGSVETKFFVMADQWSCWWTPIQSINFRVHTYLPFSFFSFFLFCRPFPWGLGGLVVWIQYWYHWRNFCMDVCLHLQLFFFKLTNLNLCSYEEVLLPMGFRAVSIVDNELAIGPRKVCQNIFS